MMPIQVRYIFGCSHLRREYHSTVIFENGLELPGAFCRDCIEDNRTERKL